MDFYKQYESDILTQAMGVQEAIEAIKSQDKFVSPLQRPPLPTKEVFLVLISCRGRVERIIPIKKLPPSGTETATFRVAARCLNQMCPPFCVCKFS
jgi:hypothetical protein